MNIMKKKVLVVDDSPSVLAMLKDILDDLGYAVTSACNGAEAYVQVESTKFNMIITDLSMPVMDGIEFIKSAKKLPNCKFVPIVVLSYANDEAKIVAARKAGASTFLNKPVNKGQFTAILQIVLGPSLLPS
jgi:two-component system chemotaxis response regulator CheY